MSGNNARREAITAAANYKHAGVPLDYKGSPAASLFGTNVFAPENEVVQVRKQVGMVFQRPNPLPLSIRDNILF